jgi:hypothetical protein
VLLLLTVENTLNRIWQVKKDRPLLKRIGLYLMLLAIGPLVLGASLWATSRLVSASMGLIGPLPPPAAFVLNLGPVVLGTVAWACLFYFVPNTGVRRRDAIAGGLLASIGFELGKRGFAAYLLQLPTYKTVYGAFAALPLYFPVYHFCFRVGDADFDAILARPRAAGLPWRSEVRGPQDRRVGTYGGRPQHLLERAGGPPVGDPDRQLRPRSGRLTRRRTGAAAQARRAAARPAPATPPARPPAACG